MNTMLRPATSVAPVKNWTMDDTKRLELAETLLDNRVGIRSAKFFTATGNAHAQLLAEIDSIELVRDSLTGMSLADIEAVIATQTQALLKDRANG